jgi:hypothetical protein
MSKRSPSPKRHLTEAQRQALSPELFSFFDELITKGHATLSTISSEVAADEFREFFGLVCPMGTGDTRTLLERMQYRNVFLHKGLERQKHVRGAWGVHGNQVLILIDSARPDPSKIKTLLHEIAEMLLEISYDHNPSQVRLDDGKRENWANKFAAFVKMPRHLFIPKFIEYQVDLEALSEIFAETLAGVTRHIRDLCLPDRPFYYGRVSLEHDPERHCPDLVPYLHQGGVCVYVVDAAKSNVIDWRRPRGGALPVYNFGKKMQFRIMHPRLRLYSLSDNPADDPPMLISRLRASAGGFGSNQLDLFDQDLAVMIFPICKTARLSGFFVVAVHHSDISLFDQVRDRLCSSRQDSMDWLFSWEKEEYARVPDALDDEKEQLDLDLYLGIDELPNEEQDKINRSRWLVESGDAE